MASRLAQVLIPLVETVLDMLRGRPARGARQRPPSDRSAGGSAASSTMRASQGSVTSPAPQATPGSEDSGSDSDADSWLFSSDDDDDDDGVVGGAADGDGGLVRDVTAVPNVDVEVVRDLPRVAAAGIITILRSQEPQPVLSAVPPVI